MTNEGAINLIGWLIFVASALAFITSSVRSGDVPSLVGGIFFLVGCLIFLIPISRRIQK